MPPLPLSGNYSETTIYAFSDSPPCVQSPAASSIVNGSEDCLYLNVYTPRFSRQNGSLIPVMVYFHGGSFSDGTIDSDTYGPDYFLNEDVIIVIFHYRVGVFGFLNTEDMASPGNYALKDQILALKWTQENIQYFGGNPHSVTAFGQSAGAACLSYLTQSPLAKGLFHRIILESGTSIHIWALKKNPRSTAKQIAQKLNVNTSTSQSLVDGLRKIDYRKLQNAATEVETESRIVENNLNTLPTAPSIEPTHPNGIIVNTSHEQLSKGFYCHVPYIIGFNSMEAITLFASDNDFVRPTLEAANLYSQMTPVYLYLFSYHGPLGSGNRKTSGVAHGEELPYLWRRSSNNESAATPSDILTRYRLIKLWTNFAKTGNPTPEEDPLLQNVIWPITKVVGEENMAYLEIDKDLVPDVNPRWSTFTFWKNLFDTFGNPPYSTYGIRH